MQSFSKMRCDDKTAMLCRQVRKIRLGATSMMRSQKYLDAPLFSGGAFLVRTHKAGSAGTRGAPIESMMLID